MIYIDVANMNGAVKPVEMYIPLRFSDGTSTTVTSTTNVYLIDGGTYSASPTSATTLCTFSASWSASTQVAFECTTWTNNASGISTVQLYDVTASALVASAVVTTSATTATVIRSGQFTLVPGHAYAVAVKTNNASYTTSICDASLIIFP